MIKRWIWKENLLVLLLRNNSFFKKMKIYCCVCGKQAVKDRNPSRDDEYITKLESSRAGFKSNEVFCGYCAEEMDENGLFPEERTNLE